MIEALKERFEKNYGDGPSVVSAAPGRVEVIGNHTDYNEGPVIGAAIDRGVSVGLKRTQESVFRFSSGTSPVVVVQDPTVRQKGPAAWTNYPLGVYNALIRRGLKPEGGFDFSVESDVPSGAGLSSSAALELATAVALNATYQMGLDNAELATASREAENDFVGMPCGILDQGVSACGKAGQLVHIDCRDVNFSNVPLGEEYSIWIFNTHKKHSLVESMYSQRHQECGDAVKQLRACGLEIDCLADVSIADFEAHRGRLDETIAKRAAHVVYEIDRVNRVKEALSSGDTASAGELLFESHASSRDLFENSVEELDYLVRILQSMPDVLGARLTGGGFGGAAMAIAGEAFSETYAESVASAYRGYFGQEPDVIRCRIADGAHIVA
jgi:galactokinase